MAAGTLLGWGRAMDELVERVGAWESAASTLRTRAGLLRAAEDVAWEGPAARAWRDEVAARASALLALADRADRVAHALRALVTLGTLR